MFVCWDLGFGEGGVWPLWVDFFVKNKEHFLFRSKVFMDLAQMEVFCFFIVPLILVVYLMITTCP